MPHNNQTQRDEELRSSILRLPRPDAQDAKYLIEVELDDLVDFIKAKQEEAVREALTTAKEIVMRKRDVYLTHRDVADESWLAIRDQLRREIVEDLDQQTPTQPNKKNG